MNVLGVFLILPVGQGPEELTRHHLGEADDGVERRTQFVAHIGEERGLGTVGQFGLLPGDRQAFLPLLDFRQHLVEAVDEFAQFVVAMLGEADGVIAGFGYQLHRLRQLVDRHGNHALHPGGEDQGDDQGDTEDSRGNADHYGKLVVEVGQACVDDYVADGAVLALDLADQADVIA